MTKPVSICALPPALTSIGGQACPDSPRLSAVHVLEKDGQKFAVATDGKSAIVVPFLAEQETSRLPDVMAVIPEKENAGPMIALSVRQFRKILLAASLIDGADVIELRIRSPKDTVRFDIRPIGETDAVLFGVIMPTGEKE
jgi:hypothetical protein